MSSNSEDFDEDELLQMALKEQSQRDLNYNKPSSNNKRPVANFVQPPKQPANQRPPAPAKARQMSMDDDDDSEVEMLSISSGDEETTSKDRRGGGGGGRGGGGGARGKPKNSASKEDDVALLDGEEPDCWKRVDEAELARRVRGMRETRTAPVAQKFEKKVSVNVTKGLNTLQSFPRGMECIDPLGLGIIDNKTLRLITDVSVSSPSKSDRDYMDNSIREKLIYFSEKFDAKLFISRIHQETGAADLEEGALALKTDLKGRTQQRKQLVKDNFDCFVSCKTTIDDIQSKLKRIEEDPEGSGTSNLFRCMQEVTSLANRALEPLFERQAQAEKIRSVQGMLQRFRTLFNLPSTIRNSITKGEYDLAVREYKKAKSVALPSHVNILKRVLEEVEKLMREFKNTLYKSMEDPQIDLTNLENAVRLLLELEPESDPNQRIRGLLEKCTIDHEARMEALHNEMRERALSDARWRKIQQDLSHSSDADYVCTLGNDQPLDIQAVELIGEEVDVLRGHYIRRLTAVLIHHIPAFWKVVLSVTSGKFAKDIIHTGHGLYIFVADNKILLSKDEEVSADSNTNTSAYKRDEKVGDGRYSSHSVDEVALMICSTISLYEAKVHQTFRDLEESNSLRSYMSDAIKEISKACLAFEAKESAPPVAVTALRALQAEITKIYIVRLCSWMRSSTDEIAKDEMWVPVSILERNRSPYTISYLPLAFRSVMSSAMDQINTMTQSLRGDASKSEEMFAQFQEIQDSVRLAFFNCFLDFAGRLEQMGNELIKKDSLTSPNGYSYEMEEESFIDLPGTVTDPHQRLLLVLSNVGYCKDDLSHELYNKFKFIWQRERDEEDSDLQDLVVSFSGLEEKVLELYTFAKANAIRTAATSYLLDSGVNWASAPAVKGVRDAAVELLHTLVAVHAEVFASARPVLEKSLGILAEGLIDTFLNIFNENPAELRLIDANGFCQLMLELEYFETVLNPYFTPVARESLKSLQGVLLEKATESASEAIENPGHNRRATRGSEDALMEERNQGMTVSPDDLIALAQQYSSELLEGQLEKTRLNTACFVENLPVDTMPEPAKTGYSLFRGAVDSPTSRNYRGTQAVGSPSFSRNRRR
ncbi:hypothetical protein ACFE04_025788 [Oxalis oulophora]